MQSTALALVPNPRAYRGQSPHYRAINHYIAVDTSAGQDGLQVWYYLFSKDYLVGYKQPPRGHAYVTGYIGRNGEASDLSQVEPFAPDAGFSSGFGRFVIESRRVYALHVGVYALPFGTKLPAPLFTAPPGETCRDVSYLYQYVANPVETVTNYCITTDKAMYLVDATGSQFLRVAHPVEKPIVNVAITPDPAVYMLLYQDFTHRGGTNTFIRVRADGTKLAQIELPELQPAFAARFETSYLPALALIPPFVIYDQLPPASGLAIVAAQSLLAGLAALLLLHRSRASRTALLLWIPIALVGGVAGLILMAGARHWPLSIRCPACGRPRRADRDRCERCQAEFLVSDPGPVGIFDRIAEPAQASKSRITQTPSGI